MGIDRFITVREVDDGPLHADALFRRGYREPAPEFPHHIVAFYRDARGSTTPASYVHFTDCGDIFLAGGACTDGDLLRAMSADEQTALRDYGGLMLATLRHGFSLYAARCEAIFTCCGDERALATTPKLGFAETGVRHLLASWSGQPTQRRRRELIAKARSFMPF
jgi:hypothetical protein